jgi:hypothetical protein
LINNTLDDDQAEKAAAGYGSPDEILSEARDRYQQSVTFDAENRTKALDDLAFLVGDQWPEQARRERELARRPILTINTLPTFVHQVTNDQRLNSPGIKIHAVDDGADIQTAKIIQGMIRHIEYASNADVVYDTACANAAQIGFGWFRLVTEYEDPKSFDQVIRFDRIRNPLSVRIDPLSKELDGSDMQWAFVEEMISREEFKRQYPDAQANNTQLLGQSTYQRWLTDKSVLVTDYYCIEKQDATLCMLADGTTAYEDELPEGVECVRKRPSVRCKVMHRKVTAVDILSEVEIKCRWIPVFPVYGDEVDIEGKVHRFGIIRNAKDPARMYNVWMTAATEEVALRPKSKYIMAEGQQEGHEAEWANANNSASPYLLYKPTGLDNGTIAPAPMRQPLADIPAGMLAMAMHAKDNIKSTTGLFDSSIGARGSATSGKQELAQQQQGDVANFHYSDNLSISIRHAGRCIVDMIPSYYDTERVVRMLGEDDTISFETINRQDPNVMDQEGGAIDAVLNDVRTGHYDVTVSTGPSFSTMRQESAEFFTNAMQAAKDPATAAIVSYLAIKNQDVPGVETATKMMATILPPAAQAVLDQENGDNEDAPEPIMTQRGPVPAEQAGQLLDALAMQAEELKAQLAKVDATKAETEKVKAEESQLKQVAMMREQQLEPQKLAAEQARTEVEAQKLEVERLKAEADLVRAQAEAEALPAKLEIEKLQLKQQGFAAMNTDEMRAMMEYSKPDVPQGMTIRAPSGATYEVQLT